MERKLEEEEEEEEEVDGVGTGTMLLGSGCGVFASIVVGFIIASLAMDESAAEEDDSEEEEEVEEFDAYLLLLSVLFTRGSSSLSSLEERYESREGRRGDERGCEMFAADDAAFDGVNAAKGAGCGVGAVAEARGAADAEREEEEGAGDEEAVLKDDEAAGRIDAVNDDASDADEVVVRDVMDDVDAAVDTLLPAGLVLLICRCGGKFAVDAASIDRA